MAAAGRGSPDLDDLADRMRVMVVGGDLPEGARCRIAPGARAGTRVLTVPRDLAGPARRWATAWAVASVVMRRDEVDGPGLVADDAFRTGAGEASDRAANAYAADVLMPWRAVIDDEGFSAGDVEGLAARFEVSPAVARMRMDELRRLTRGRPNLRVVR